jgi:hypothetical protein
MGDGVLVYFGYSQAREDDAERVVRVGLELVATGLVVVGDLIGSERVSGASHRWRDAKPCGTLAGRCGAEHGRHCGKHSEARWQAVRA